MILLLRRIQDMFSRMIQDVKSMYLLMNAPQHCSAALQMYGCSQAETYARLPMTHGMILV